MFSMLSPALGKTEAARRVKMYFFDLWLENSTPRHGKILVIVGTAKSGRAIPPWLTGGAGWAL
jgi:hypothetical protein